MTCPSRPKRSSEVWRKREIFRVGAREKVEKVRSIRATLAVLVLAGIFALNAVPVRSYASSVLGNVPITDFDPSDDIHEDTAML